VVFEELQSPEAVQVFAAGLPVTESPAPAGPSEPVVLEMMHVDPAKVTWGIPAAGDRMRVIVYRPGTLLTGATLDVPTIQDGMAVADSARDLVKLAVVERYTGACGTGLGFVRGLGLKRGAIAASVAHDAHNIVIAGVDDGDMALALATIASMGGGLVAVADGGVRARLALSVAGLMADCPLADVRVALDRVTTAARDQGATMADPFMALSFLALSVIPTLKLTDKGLVDVDRFEIVPLFED